MNECSNEECTKSKALDCPNGLCGDCCEGCPRHKKSNKESSDDEAINVHNCQVCGYDLTYITYEEHCEEYSGECFHTVTITLGANNYCKCCGEDLGEWQTNAEFYDTIGAPYDDPYS